MQGGTETQSQRILALDILRGITIAGMILVNNPGSWANMYAPLCHAEWNGLTPTDLIFPFFMFIMGISAYISLSKTGFRYTHALGWKILKRSVLICLIGMAVGWFAKFCYYWASPAEGLSFGERLWESVWTFDRLRYLGVMPRLGWCYGISSLIVLTVSHRRLPYIIGALLLAYGVLLLGYNGFEYNETNILSIVDRWVLTPQHMYNDNGIDPEGVLSTIPSIAHVLLGFCVGRMIFSNVSSEDRNARLNRQLIQLFLVGTVLTFVGFLLSYGCPINKKVWSPTFVLTTCGMGASLLGLLIWLIDVKGYKRWTLFFEVYGINPLFMYVLGGVLGILMGAIRLPYGTETVSIRGLFYSKLFTPLMGETNASLAYALLVVAISWVIGYQLYKRKIYIKL